MWKQFAVGTLLLGTVCAPASASLVGQEISIVSAVCVFDPNTNELWVHGQVQNTTGKQFPNLEMSFTYLDASGDKIDADTAVLETDPPSPGQSATFHHGFLSSNLGGYMSVNMLPINDNGTPIPNETYLNVFCPQLPGGSP